ncbi:unnamed protein product, partial [Tetraodon nigroviridis]
LTRTYNLSISPYYVTEEDSPFICSAPRENGMLRCHDVPAYSEGWGGMLSHGRGGQRQWLC